MESALQRAGAVVCHGGTGSVVLTRHRGLRPIVVPRIHALGEHVDDHQVAFTRQLASRGEIELAESEERLRELLDAFAEGRFDPRSATDVSQTDEAVRRFEELVGRLLDAGSRRA
jgi:UDP-N-acetylglucosamine transferase subunit ALG13